MKVFLSFLVCCAQILPPKTGRDQPEGVLSLNNTMKRSLLQCWTSAEYTLHLKIYEEGPQHSVQICVFVKKTSAAVCVYWRGILSTNASWEMSVQSVAVNQITQHLSSIRFPSCCSLVWKKGRFRGIRTLNWMFSLYKLPRISVWVDLTDDGRVCVCVCVCVCYSVIVFL